MHLDPLYSRYREAIQGKPLPLAFVDLDAFDANIEYAARLATKWGKTIRLGTKSVRCEPLLQRIFQLGGQTYRGCGCPLTVFLSPWAIQSSFNMPRQANSVSDSMSCT